jgi:RNA polymerase sigma-70 factor (ECF subfamily)
MIVQSLDLLLDRPMLHSKNRNCSPGACFQWDDVSVMREPQGGNDDALAILYDRYYNAVLGVGLRALRDRGEAEDLLQNVFLEIANGVGQFDPTYGTVLMWILQCAYGRSLNRRNYLLVRQISHSQLGDDAHDAKRIVRRDVRVHERRSVE